VPLEKRAGIGGSELRKTIKSGRIKKDDKKWEKEKKKGADRARKSYVKSIKNGKPARRPYKHKNSTEE